MYNQKNSKGAKNLKGYNQLEMYNIVLIAYKKRKNE